MYRLNVSGRSLIRRFRSKIGWFLPIAFLLLAILGLGIGRVSIGRIWIDFTGAGVIGVIGFIGSSAFYIRSSHNQFVRRFRSHIGCLAVIALVLIGILGSVFSDNEIFSMLSSLGLLVALGLIAFYVIRFFVRIIRYVHNKTKP